MGLIILAHITCIPTDAGSFLFVICSFVNVLFVLERFRLHLYQAQCGRRAGGAGQDWLTRGTEISISIFSSPLCRKFNIFFSHNVLIILGLKKKRNGSSLLTRWVCKLLKASYKYTSVGCFLRERVCLSYTQCEHLMRN